ncbi:hypothetical protein [Streptomyces sp. MBT65]|uniref:hypothetical protein n=1 Tax=Streptomyces sp. MBT65 TaxID=1488395 RepID=UPI0027DA1FFC|nr:hypothetical protein [Streptomyces sp. MBT65]
MLDVAKVVRQLTGLSLWRGKLLVTEVPVVALGGVPEADAEVAGAEAEIREWQPPNPPMP